MPNTSIQRKKLLEFAAQHSEQKALYIQAPAGYGKTVFAGHWLDAKDGPRAMLSLDEYDNAPFDFCWKLKGLLEELYPDNAPMLAFTGHPGFNSAPNEFLMRAAAAVSKTGSAYMVIDDLHYITDASVQKLLLIFLMRLPANIKILILSRTAPPQAFSGLLLKNGLALISQEQMLFDSEEIYTLFRSNRAAITKKQAELIYRFTEGWPIEINALLIAGVEIPERSTPHRELEDFLKTQVWETWDETSRDFMVKTSIEEELSLPLCRAMTGREDSENILELLLSKSAFLVRRADGSYRFHRLFREFLLKLFQDWPENLRREQYRLAGKFYLEKGDFYRATDRFSQVRDHGQIARCFDLLEQMDRTGFDTERVMAAVRQNLNREIAQEYPFLFYMLAYTARNDGRIEAFKSYADQYYANYPRVVERNPELAHNIFFLYVLDFRYTFAAISQMAAGGPAGVTFQGVRGSATNYFPYYHRSFRDFSEMARGDLDENVDRLNLRLGALLGEEREMLIDCIRAGLYYERGEVLRAQKLALNAAAKIQNSFAPESRFCVLALLLACNYALHQEEQAEVIRSEIQGMIETEKAYSLQGNFDAVVQEHRLSSGNEAAAQEWLAVSDAEVYEQLGFYRLPKNFTTARAHIACGNFDKAIIMLHQICNLCSMMERPLDVIEAKILLAISCWKKKRGYQKEALSHLEEAVLAAQQFGYQQVFVHEGAELESMLSNLKGRTSRSDYDGALSGEFVKKLHIGAAEEAAHSKGLTGGRVEQAVQFTKQQKRVMALLCEGYGYRKIGETLGIQFSTVRSHVELIYKKLDVSGAKEAILKIRQLNVLGTE